MARAVATSGMLACIDDNPNIHETRGAMYRPQEIVLLKTKVKRVKASVKELRERDIVLDSGPSISADYLICCTGYSRSRSLPAIECRARGAHRGVAIDPTDQKLLYRGMIDPRAPRVVFFTGEFIFASQLFGFSIAAQWAVNYVTRMNAARLTSAEMTRQIAMDDTAVNRGVNREYIYSWTSKSSMSQGMPYLNGEAAFRYLTQILEDLGVEAKVGEAMYRCVHDPDAFDRLAVTLTEKLASIPR